jgi:activator of 2-hydroxyglutaryl-CoA dehydratase
LFLGIDVGSISMKFSLFLPEGSTDLSADLRGTFLDPEGVALPGAGKGYILSYDRLLGDPVRKVPERVRRWRAVLGEENVRAIAVTGRSGRQLAPIIGATYENDFRCLVKAITATHPEVRTIFEMGGENAKVIRLEASGDAGLLTVKDYDTTARRVRGRSSTSRRTG